MQNESFSVQRTDPNYNRLCKIQLVITTISERFLEVYNPHGVSSINEAMIHFKGRSSLKQYLPKKPTKRAIKVWMRADAMNGFVSQFLVYLCKVGGRSETQLGKQVGKISPGI